MSPENPPAFPSHPSMMINGERTWGVEGMSLRDWFAGQVIAGLASATDSEGLWTAHDAAEMAAKLAYSFADALLAERAKGGAA